MKELKGKKKSFKENNVKLKEGTVILRFWGELSNCKIGRSSPLIHSSNRSKCATSLWYCVFFLTLSITSYSNLYMFMTVYGNFIIMLILPGRVINLKKKISLGDMLWENLQRQFIISYMLLIIPFKNT